MGNCACFDAAEFTAATGGEWRNGCRIASAQSIYTDSREAGAGRMFLALAGETFDAHDFLASAIASGAGSLCVARARESKIPADCPVPVLLVAEPLAALQALAHFHRRRFPGLRLAAVTGSVGKTSVKEMLRAIFTAAAGSAEHVLYTIGNTNNQIGVPQNLLRLTDAIRYAVIEMGTNHHGEIEPLSRMAEPDAAIVNTIAPCHLEFLGDLNGVAREKAHVWDGMPKNGTAVYPESCDGLAVLAARAREFQQLRFGTGAMADVRAEFLSGDLTGSRFALVFPCGQRLEIEWALAGEHQTRNAAGAAAVALALGIEPAVIASGLAETALPGMRMAKSVVKGVTYINDAYNANPGSMAASLAMLAATPPEHLVLLLGDMLELGEFEAAEHRRILELARRTFPESRILTVGPRFAAASKGIAGVDALADSAAAGVRLAELVKAGTVVFLKGSRGMKLEKALPVA